MDGTNLCVYCGSSSGVRPEYALQAEQLGREMAARDLGLVYGGGRIGLMGIVADAVLDEGGRVHGIIPEHLVRLETAHTGLTSIETVKSMHERKARMEEMSSGFIVMPGGFGTLDEAFEILTWNQLGLMNKPIVFFDPNGFFDPLVAAIEHMTEEGFVSRSASSIAQRSDTVGGALDLVTAKAPVVEGKLRTLDVTSKRSLR